MKNLSFKKFKVAALNDSEIKMVKGGAVTAELEEAKTRRIGCCSCCVGTSCNTKKIADDSTSGN